MGLTSYYTPTEVIFGKGAEKEIGKLVRKQNCKKVLVHYGSEHAKKSGLLDKVTNALATEGIAYVTLGGVVPNPRLSLVNKGIALCKEEGVDFILAVGGGSVIDSSKAIGYGLFNGGNVWDFYDKTRVVKGCYPVGAILTIAAAGSEMSDSSVITNEEGNLKRGLSSDYCRLRFAIMNPELTYTLPAFQTACSAVDIMMHTMERFFITGESLTLTDRLALALVKETKEAGSEALQNPQDYNARANLMWASSLSHNGLMAFGNESNGDWSCHQMEHELSGMFDVAHGAGLAAVWPSWARYVMDVKPERFAQFGEVVFGIKRSPDAKNDAEQTIKAMEDYYASIHMPRRISELGITVSDEEIETLAEKCTFFGKRKIGIFQVLGKKEIADIYRMAR